MSALAWLRGKARLASEDTFDISEEQATESGCAPGRIRSRTWTFRGRLPYRMVVELRRGGEALEQSEMVTEVIRLGTGYRGGECACYFGRTVLEYIAPPDELAR